MLQLDERSSFMKHKSKLAILHSLIDAPFLRTLSVVTRVLYTGRAPGISTYPRTALVKFCSCWKCCRWSKNARTEMPQNFMR